MAVVILWAEMNEQLEEVDIGPHWKIVWPVTFATQYRTCTHRSYHIGCNTRSAIHTKYNNDRILHITTAIFKLRSKKKIENVKNKIIMHTRHSEVVSLGDATGNNF